MRVDTWLAHATARLTAAGITSARLDALILLEDCLRRDRSWLLAHPDHTITASHTTLLDSQLARRASHEPLAYIRGRAEFYGHTFLLSNTVLVPWPETEAVVSLSKELIMNNIIVHVADIGTGSGCLAITLALEFPALNIVAYDINAAALAVAKQNAGRLKARVQLVQSDLLVNLKTMPELIVTNLPYVPDDFPINPAAGFEPRLALFSGQDGLHHYRTFWTQVQKIASKPLFIVAESFPAQHAAHTKIAAGAGYGVTRTDGFAQQFEQLSARPAG